MSMAIATSLLCLVMLLLGYPVGYSLVSLAPSKLEGSFVGKSFTYTSIEFELTSAFVLSARLHTHKYFICSELSSVEQV